MVLEKLPKPLLGYGRESNHHVARVSYWNTVLRCNHRGLSLIELMIVFALISVMMVLSLPMLSTANERARSELCQQNLVEITQTIVEHAEDTGRLPTMQNLQPIHAGMSLPEFIRLDQHTPNVLFCPSDDTENSQRFETSYQWTMTFNDKSPGELTQYLGQAILADREAYHQNAVQTINEMIVELDEDGLRLGLLRNESQGPSSNRPAIYFKPKNNKPKKPKKNQSDDDDD